MPYWQHKGVRIWVLQARGKHGPVRAGFVIRQGEITGTKILSSKEKRGTFIKTSRFLRQFAGIGLKKNQDLDRRIDGYSGATRSVNAMRKMARLALGLDSLVSESSETVPKTEVAQ